MSGRIRYYYSNKLPVFFILAKTELTCIHVLNIEHLINILKNLPWSLFKDYVKNDKVFAKVCEFNEQPMYETLDFKYFPLFTETLSCFLCREKLHLPEILSLSGPCCQMYIRSFSEDSCPCILFKSKIL